MQDGEQNTINFHKFVQSKQARGRISSLVCSDESIENDEQGISTEIVSFYKRLVGSCDPNCIGGSRTQLQSFLASIMPIEFHDRLVSAIFDEEIFVVIKGMLKNKSLDPDGYTSEFYIAM